MAAALVTINLAVRLLMKYALIGRIGSGKSHLARQFSDRWKAQVLSFGQPVYELAQKVLGRPVDKSRSGDRLLLKQIGTSWGRNGEPIDPHLDKRLREAWPSRHGYPDMWVDKLVERMQAGDPLSNVVVDDARFNNEIVRLVEDHSFLPFLVMCTDDTRSLRLRARGENMADALDQHPSEQIANLLNRVAFDEMILPIVWNDTANEPADVPWSISAQRWVQMDGVDYEHWRSFVSISRLKRIMG